MGTIAIAAVVVLVGFPTADAQLALPTITVKATSPTFSHKCTGTYTERPEANGGGAVFDTSPLLAGAVVVASLIVTFVTVVVPRINYVYDYDITCESTIKLSITGTGAAARRVGVETRYKLDADGTQLSEWIEDGAECRYVHEGKCTTSYSVARITFTASEHGMEERPVTVQVCYRASDVNIRAYNKLDLVRELPDLTTVYDLVEAPTNNCQEKQVAWGSQAGYLNALAASGLAQARSGAVRF